MQARTVYAALQPEDLYGSAPKAVRFNGQTFQELRQRLAEANLPGFTVESFIEVKLDEGSYTCFLDDEILPEGDLQVIVHNFADGPTWKKPAPWDFGFPPHLEGPSRGPYFSPDWGAGRKGKRHFPPHHHMGPYPHHHRGPPHFGPHPLMMDLARLQGEHGSCHHPHKHHKHSCSPKGHHKGGRSGSHSQEKHLHSPKCRGHKHGPGHHKKGWKLGHKHHFGHGHCGRRFMMWRGCSPFHYARGCGLPGGLATDEPALRRSGMEEDPDQPGPSGLHGDIASGLENLGVISIGTSGTTSTSTSSSK